MGSIRPNVLFYSVEKREHNLESEGLSWNPLYSCVVNLFEQVNYSLSLDFFFSKIEVF